MPLNGALLAACLTLSPGFRRFCGVVSFGVSEVKVIEKSLRRGACAYCWSAGGWLFSLVATMVRGARGGADDTVEFCILSLENDWKTGAKKQKKMSALKMLRPVFADNVKNYQ